MPPRQRRSSGATRAVLTCARRYPRDERRLPTVADDEAQAARAADLRRNAARDDVTTRLTTGAAAARGLSGGGHCHCSHQGRGGGTPGRPRAALKTPGPDRGRLATGPRKCARAHRLRTTACYPNFPRAVTPSPHSSVCAAVTQGHRWERARRRERTREHQRTRLKHVRKRPLQGSLYVSERALLLKRGRSAKTAQPT